MRADLQSARLRRSAPPLPGLTPPLLDTATQMMAQDEQWQAAPSRPAQSTTTASPSAKIHRHQPATDLPVLEYVRASDGQFYALGERTDTGASAEPAAETVARAYEAEIKEPKTQMAATPADRGVSAYQRTAGFIAEPLGLVTPPPSVEMVA